MKAKFIGIVVITALTASIFVSATAFSEQENHPPHLERHAAANHQIESPTFYQANSAAIESFAQYNAEQAWYFGIEAQRRLDAAKAAIATIGGGGSVYRGPHSDAWWQGVAQCEQGGRNDEYFGYFSFMDGSAAGKSWNEQVAMGNAVLARSRSESPAWAPSCVAAGYRASPSG